MKKFGYFENLSLAARWFLPWEEAKGVIEDYRDILMEVKGPEEAVKRFGTPVQAVLATADRKDIVYAAAVCCTEFSAGFPPNKRILFLSGSYFCSGTINDSGVCVVWWR